MEARGEASPDDGDTLAMTFAIKVALQLRLGRDRQPELALRTLRG
jgi:hypothetical protein